MGDYIEQEDAGETAQSVKEKNKVDRVQSNFCPSPHLGNSREPQRDDRGKDRRFMVWLAQDQ